MPKLQSVSVKASVAVEIPTNSKSPMVGLAVWTAVKPEGCLMW